MDACPEGGTVSVSAGTYTEAVRIYEKRIALIGADTPTINLYSSSTNESAVYFIGTMTDNAVISGFRIIGATGDFPYGY